MDSTNNNKKIKWLMGVHEFFAKNPSLWRVTWALYWRMVFMGLAIILIIVVIMLVFSDS